MTNEWPDWADLPRERYTGEAENRIRRSMSGEVVMTEIEYTRARRAIARQEAGERLAAVVRTVAAGLEVAAMPTFAKALQTALAAFEASRA